MSTIGQFNSKNPTIKRILKEARELSTSPSPDYYAAPLESNLFEWHFTIRGPPSPSPYAKGIYHGRIVLPNSYPLRPPSFRFTTPTGRFEVNREICLSISGHHEEMWQPAWGVRTALVAIRSFMDSDAKGQLGGLDSTEAVRLRFAEESRSWRCSGCGGKTNDEIIKETEAACEAAGVDAKSKEETIPEELRLGYKDELGKSKDNTADVSTGATVPRETPSVPAPEAAASNQIATAPEPVANAAASRSTTIQQQHSSTSQPSRSSRPPQRSTSNWIDTAIWGVAIALVIMLLRKYLAMT